MMLYNYSINCFYLEFNMMMKKNISILGVLFVLCFSMTLNGQDLIDRTRTNTTLNSTAAPNAVAELINLERNSSSGFSPVSMFSVNEQKNIYQYQDYLHDAVFLSLNTRELQSAYNTRATNIELEIPVTRSKSFELELTRVEVLTPDFLLKTSDGREYTYDQIPVVFYRGIVKGDVNSTATITVFKNQIKGLITDHDGNYVLAQISDQVGEYTLYNDVNLVAENTSQCGTDDDLMAIGADVAEQIESPQRSTNCVEIFIETDQYTYLQHGSVLNFQNFLTSLFSEVATLYANENINISLSEVLVWTTPDPYASLNSTSAILDKFGEIRKNNYTGRLAHFISSRNLGGGIAWLNVLCYNYFNFNADWNGDGIAETHHAGPYAVSGSISTSVTPIPSYSWNVNVFAHEMGHNFGSPHTQKCTWGPNNNAALDNCVNTQGSCGAGPAPSNGGTVMSYCHVTSYGINFNNGFGDEPGDLIRSNYNNSSCNLACENAVQLPVELVTFTAKEGAEQSALLQWTTATEWNSSHFEIERQTADKNWESLDKVMAIGQTTDIQRYEFEDHRPEKGENFYRLKQVDINGDYVYSDVEVLTFEGKNDIVFNNPVNDVLSIQISTLDAKAVRIAMYDAQGRLVEQRSADLYEGYNTVEWDMSHLSTGIYFMKVEDDSSTMFKLVKM